MKIKEQRLKKNTHIYDIYIYINIYIYIYNHEKQREVFYFEI